MGQAAKKMNDDAEVVQSSKTKDRSVTAAQKKRIDGMDTWSAKMRYMDSEGFTNGEIARYLGKRPQHVRNVLVTPVKNPRSA